MSRSEAKARESDFPQLNALPPTATKINPPESPPNTQPTDGDSSPERLKFAPVDNPTPCGQPATPAHPQTPENGKAPSTMCWGLPE
ncbi:hypothetical protein Aglo03_67290 [Actinokineospora globicatena]|uniref:Uncharacterized protein n=1 Tax=Actinokineospora globicatena TaxID=103729 RepID=A0A9W6VED4_9PSEU|nr:hypothetical protein Aglo03_67290 [Actinokineospora globicatena]